MTGGTSHTASFQGNPILYGLLQHFFTAGVFDTRFPNSIYVTCLIASNPLWLMAVILPTRKHTIHCTLTYRWTRIYRTHTNIETEKGKGRGPKVGFEHRASMEISVNLWKMAVGLFKKWNSVGKQLVSKGVISKH